MLAALLLIGYDSATFCYFFLTGSAFSNLREMIIWLAFFAAYSCIAVEHPIADRGLLL